MTRINRNVVVGAAVAVVAIVLIWWFLLWSPRNKDYNTANAIAQAADAQVEQLQAQVSRLESIKAQIPQFQAELAKLQVAVPDKAQLDQIILAINGAADQSGVELDGIAPSPPSAGGTGPAASAAPASIRVSLNLKGDYDQALDFMNRLDTLPRLLVIDTVNLAGTGSGTGASSSSGGAELSISMTVRLFVTSAPPAAPGATTTTTTPGAGSTTTTAPAAGSSTSTTAPTTTTTAGPVTGG